MSDEQEDEKVYYKGKSFLQSNTIQINAGFVVLLKFFPSVGEKLGPDGMAAAILIVNSIMVFFETRPIVLTWFGNTKTVEVKKI